MTQKKSRSLKDQRELQKIDQMRARTERLRTKTRVHALKEILTIVTALFTGYAGATAIHPSGDKSPSPSQTLVEHLRDSEPRMHELGERTEPWVRQAELAADGQRYRA
jgi:hypothetical protein